MKIYHVETQQAYDELMIELEEKGYKWLSENKPTDLNYWEQRKENSCIEIQGKGIAFGHLEQCIKQYPYTHIIKYKAKGEEMTQEKMTQEEMKQKEMKQNILDLAKGVFVEVGAFARDMPEVEADLQEAKSSAKKLIEKIDEYLEFQKPKFKVDDYVIVDVKGRKIITKIDELTENKTVAHGLWYDRTEVNVEKDFWYLKKGSKFRHATSEEIAEYVVALTFHKHGRKPFEVKRGDVVYLKGYDKNIFLDSGNIYKKHNFVNGDVVFVKTAEEVNEWLGADDENRKMY